MPFSKEIDTSARRLFAFGCFDPSTVDVETDAIFARIVVITTHSTMMASVARTEHLFGFILGVIVVFCCGRSGGCGIMPIVFRIVFRHSCGAAERDCRFREAEVVLPGLGTVALPMCPR